MFSASGTCTSGSSYAQLSALCTSGLPWGKVIDAREHPADQCLQLSIGARVSAGQREQPGDLFNIISRFSIARYKRWGLRV